MKKFLEQYGKDRKELIKNGSWKCEHKQFEAKVDVIRLEDIKRFMAEVHVKCIECDTPFQFLGMEMGLDCDKPMIEVDGCEARLPIAPQGEVPHPLGRKFVKGFSIKKVSD